MKWLIKDIEKTRKFNLYFLALVSFLVAFGRGIEFNSTKLVGKHLENILVIPIFFTAISAVHAKEYRWPITIREKIFLSYALFISLMPFWGIYLDRSLDALREFWAAAAFAGLIFYNLKDEKDLKFLLYSFIIGATLGGCLGIIQYLNDPRPLTAYFRNQIAYGMFLSSPLSLIFALFFYSSDSNRMKILLLLSFIIVSFALLFTLCRAALISIVIAMGLFSIILNKRALIFLLLVITFLVSYIIFFPNSPIPDRIRSIKWEDTSLQIRIQGIWPSAMAIFKDHNPIIGTGSGAFPILVNTPKYLPKKSDFLLPKYHAHNHFLQALISQGIIGAFMYLFFVSQVAYLSWYLYKYSLSPLTKSIGVAGLVWILSNTIAGIVQHEFRDSRYNMGVGFIVTIVVLSYYLSKYSSCKIENFSVHDIS